MGGERGVVHPDSWAMIAYFALVALGIALQMSERDYVRRFFSEILHVPPPAKFKWSRFGWFFFGAFTEWWAACW